MPRLKYLDSRSVVLEYSLGLIVPYILHIQSKQRSYIDNNRMHSMYQFATGIGNSQYSDMIIQEQHFSYQVVPDFINLPFKVKTQHVHFRSHANYILLPKEIPEDLVDDQCSSITKGCMYHIKHVYKTVYIIIPWEWIDHKKWTLNGSTYYV